MLSLRLPDPGVVVQPRSAFFPRRQELCIAPKVLQRGGGINCRSIEAAWLDSLDFLPSEIQAHGLSDIVPRPCLNGMPKAKLVVLPVAVGGR